MDATDGVRLILVIRKGKVALIFGGILSFSSSFVLVIVIVARVLSSATAGGSSEGTNTTLAFVFESFAMLSLVLASVVLSFSFSSSLPLSLSCAWDCPMRYNSLVVLILPYPYPYPYPDIPAGNETVLPPFLLFLLVFPAPCPSSSYSPDTDTVTDAEREGELDEDQVLYIGGEVDKGDGDIGRCSDSLDLELELEGRYDVECHVLLLKYGLFGFEEGFEFELGFNKGFALEEFEFEFVIDLGFELVLVLEYGAVDEFEGRELAVIDCPDDEDGGDAILELVNALFEFVYVADGVIIECPLPASPPTAAAENDTRR